LSNFYKKERHHKVSQKEEEGTCNENFSFYTMNGYLYKLGPNNDVLRICVLEHERDSIIEEAHVGLIGGNFHVDTTTKKYYKLDYDGLNCTKIVEKR
jgi:hypothetical protein